MTPCVCGHGRADHADVQASVPLINPRPIYPIQGSALNNGIHRTHLTATYDQQLCACGCTQFTPDDEADCFTHRF